MEPQDRDLLTRALDVLEEQNARDDQDQHAESVALAKAFMPPEPDHELMAEQARVFIAKAEAANHDRALAALGARDASGPAVLAKSASPGDLAALARLSARMELRDRIAAQPPEDNRGRLPWQVNPTTASVDEQVRMVEQLAAAG